MNQRKKIAAFIENTELNCKKIFEDYYSAKAYLRRIFSQEIFTYEEENVFTEKGYQNIEKNLNTYIDINSNILDAEITNSNYSSIEMTEAYGNVKFAKKILNIINKGTWFYHNENKCIIVFIANENYKDLFNICLEVNEI